MAPLSAGKESALAKAGNYAKRISWVSRDFLACVCVHSAVSFLYTARAGIQHLHSTRKMVIVRADFSGKQSHEIGPSSTKIVPQLYRNCVVP